MPQGAKWVGAELAGRQAPTPPALATHLCLAAEWSQEPGCVGAEVGLEGCRSRLCFQTSAPTTSVQVDKEPAQSPQAWLKFPQRAPAGPALSSGRRPSPWCVLGRHLRVA